MIFHVVKPGETIYSISQQYQISTQRLISDNALYGLDGLVVGQCLLIAIPEVIHVVNPGETLYSISLIYGTTVYKLLQHNPSLINNMQLQPGETLTIKYENQTEKTLDIYGYVYPFINNNLLKVQSVYSTSMFLVLIEEIKVICFLYASKSSSLNSSTAIFNAS